MLCERIEFPSLHLCRVGLNKIHRPLKQYLINSFSFTGPTHTLEATEGLILVVYNGNADGKYFNNITVIFVSKRRLIIIAVSDPSAFRELERILATYPVGTSCSKICRGDRRSVIYCNQSPSPNCNCYIRGWQMRWWTLQI